MVRGSRYAFSCTKVDPVPALLKIPALTLQSTDHTDTHIRKTLDETSSCSTSLMMPPSRTTSAA